MPLFIVFTSWAFAVAVGHVPPPPMADAAARSGPEQRSLSEALTVDAGATCLSADRLRTRVHSWLGRDAIDARMSVHVVGDASDPFTLSFTLFERGESIAHRRFAPAPENCAEMHAVVGLAIALAIDATALEGLPPPEIDVVPPDDVAPSEPRRPPPLQPRSSARDDARARSRRPDRRPFAVRLGLHGGPTLGLPPPVGGFGAIAVELGWANLVDLRLSVLGGGSAPRNLEPSALGTRGRASVSLVGVRLDTCIGPRLRIVRPRGCGGFIGGAAIGVGRDFESERIALLPWLAFAVGGDLRIAVHSRVDFEIGSQAVVNISRPAFDFFDPASVRRLGREFQRVGGLFSVGLAVTLW